MCDTDNREYFEIEEQLRFFFQELRELGIDTKELFSDKPNMDCILDMSVMSRILETFKLLSAFFSGTGNKVSISIDQTYVSGFVCVEGRKALFSKSPVFYLAYNIADEVEISPYIDGTYEMNFCFYRLSIPLENVKE